MRKVFLLVAVLFCWVLIEARPQNTAQGTNDEIELEFRDTVAVDSVEVVASNYSPIETAFINFPDTILTILPRDIRLDMLDYYKAGTAYRPVNELGGNSSLEKVSSDYLKVKVSDVSTLELKMLADKKRNSIFVAVYTVGGSASDSEIFFFTSDMTMLQTSKLFREPELKDFFFIPKGSMTKMKEIEEMVPFPTVEYSLSEMSDELTGRLTVGEYINQDDYNIMKLFLIPELKWHWNGSKYVFVKK